MRTTVNIDDRLLKEAKKVAAERGATLARVLEDALREALSRRNSVPQRRKVRLTTFAGVGEGAGVQRGVDLSDSAALLELMEREDADSGC
jgi:hypothetical protein